MNHMVEGRVQKLVNELVARDSGPFETAQAQAVDSSSAPYPSNGQKRPGIVPQPVFEQLEAYKAEMENLRAYNAELEQDTLILEQQHAAQQEDSADLKAQVSNLTEECFEHKQLYETMMQPLSAPAQDGMTAKQFKHFHNALVNVENLRDTATKMRSELKSLRHGKSILGQYKENNEKLKRELAEAKQEINILQGEIQSKKGRPLASILRTNTRLRREIYQLKGPNMKEESDDRVNVSKNKLLKLEKSEVEFRDKYNELLQALTDAEKEIRTRDEQIASLKLQPKAERTKAELKTHHEYIAEVEGQGAQLEQDEVRELSKPNNNNLQKQITERDHAVTKFRQANTKIKLRPEKDVAAAKKAKSAAEIRVSKMFEHYDTVQSNDTVLIGKLIKMGLAGGFGGPGTIYRKELDSLKAPPLTELEEYNDRA